MAVASEAHGTHRLARPVAYSLKVIKIDRAVAIDIAAPAVLGAPVRRIRHAFIEHTGIVEHSNHAELYVGRHEKDPVAAAPGIGKVAVGVAVQAAQRQSCPPQTGIEDAEPVSAAAESVIDRGS